jgi:hypothetical protein
MNPETSDNAGDRQARRLQAVYVQLVQTLGQSTGMQSSKTAGADEDWSATEVLGHLVEMIPYWMNSCQTIIAASTPPSFGRGLDAPERLAGVEQGTSRSLPTLLTLLQREVEGAAAAIRQMSPEDRSKQGVHLVRGEMTVAEIVEAMIVAHAEAHLAQVQATLASANSL